MFFQSAVTQASGSDTLPISEFNCEDLTSHVQTLKESTRSKKEKFSCILNLLKSALTEELETPQRLAEINGMNSIRNVVEDKISDVVNQTLQENETENTNSGDRELYDKLLSKATRDITKNTPNIEVPTMIPIFKPRPVIRNDFENINSVRLRSIPVAPDIVHANSNPINIASKFSIPCQRAADVLDMSVALPREVTMKKHEETMQPNVKPNPLVPTSLVANQTPTTVSIHCADSDESLAIMFKPKAISLTQLYGNLLKKITITVLVPYHLSKVGTDQ